MKNALISTNEPIQVIPKLRETIGGHALRKFLDNFCREESRGSGIYKIIPELVPTRTLEKRSGRGDVALKAMWKYQQFEASILT